MLDHHHWLRSLWGSIQSARPAAPARRRRTSRGRSFAAAEALEMRILPTGVAFSADSYEFHMTEGDSSGFVGTVAANDPTGYGLMFWVEESPTWDFYLDYDGTLYFFATPDYEQESSYTLVVGATDGMTVDYATVVVQITNIDDEPPVFDQTDFSITRPEDEAIAPGTLLTTVTASDPDTDASDLTYTLLTVGTPFSVAANGDVLIDGPLDYETESWYSLEIEVFDTNGQTALTTLTVELTDVDDEAPTVLGLQGFSIGDNSEPGAWVGTVDAWDVDTDQSDLTFAIVGGNEFGHFEIDDYGNISLAIPVDHTVVPSYDLTVAVSDGTQTTLTTVHIDVIFENEAPEITEFGGATDGGNIWTFSGRVEDDESVYCMTITFGGILEGYYAFVEADGTFTITVTFDPGTTGIASAQAADEHGFVSNLAEDYVF